MTVSVWWLLAAFIVGGYAGILLVALMHFASQEPERAASAAGARLDFARCRRAARLRKLAARS